MVHCFLRSRKLYESLPHIIRLVNVDMNLQVHTLTANFQMQG